MKVDQPRGGTPDLISTPDELFPCLDQLTSGSGPFALDTERAHGIRYSTRAYLIQVKRTGGGLHLIDPVALTDHMVDVGRVLATDEWILHAADQDLPCLRMEGLTTSSLFDTEIAAMLLGDDKISLQAVLEQNLGVELAKEHSNSDWSKRPLSEALLNYAALDVDYLIELRAALTERLEQAGRIKWLVEECEYVLHAPEKPPVPDPWRKIAASAGAKDRRTLAILKELWDTRDALAHERDIAPGKVLANKALSALVSSLPETKEEAQAHPILQGKRGAYAGPLWAAIDRGRHAKELPPRHRPSDSEIPDPRQWARQHEDAARRWDELRPAVLQRAEEIGIRQDVLVKPAIQREAAWRGWTNLTEATHVFINAGARPWQVEELAPVLPRSLT